MQRNHTMMQFFEWHIEPEGIHWNRLRELAPELKKKESIRCGFHR